jgi:Mn-dependent DtxR family transcriptional regulator
MPPVRTINPIKTMPILLPAWRFLKDSGLYFYHRKSGISTNAASEKAQRNMRYSRLTQNFLLHILKLQKIISHRKNIGDGSI